MNIDAIPISVLFKDNEDLYEKVVVGAQRQRQIIDSRSLRLEAFQDIEDTEQLEQFDDIDHDIEKPISVAMQELLCGELEWRHSADDKESE